MIPDLTEACSKFIPAEKAQVFVAHIQQHLNKHEYNTFPYDQSKGRTIPHGKVGCKICEKSIDRIYSEWNRAKKKSWTDRLVEDIRQTNREWKRAKRERSRE